MKRFFTFVSLAFVACAIPALAQEVKLPSATNTVDFNEPVPVKAIIKLLAEDSGFGISYDDDLPETETWSGTLVVSTLPATLRTILEPKSFEAVPDGWTIHIRRRSSTQPAEPTEPTTPATGAGTRTEDQPGQTTRKSTRTSTFGGSTFGLGIVRRYEPAQPVQEETELQALPPQATPPVDRGTVSGGWYTGSTFGLGLSAVGYYSRPGYYPIDPTYGARFAGAARTGWLKIYAQGDTDFAEHLVVLRQVGTHWEPVGAGGKAFRSWHDPIELEVGHQTLRFELREGGQTTYLEEEFTIYSKFDREHPFQYPISREMMNSYSKVTQITR